MQQNTHSDKIILRNKFGRNYQCQLPEIRTNSNKYSSKSLDIDNSLYDIAQQLLDPMRKEPCLMMNQDWWSYEFCYGNSNTTASIGSVTSIRDEVRYASSIHPKPDRMFYTLHGHYANGTNCERTGMPRKSTVRFTCLSDVEKDRILRVDEFETCHYVITISTKKLCSIPVFQGTKAYKITCDPLLSKKRV